MEETPSFWSQKPWWCQPWSIVATGVAVVVGSWMLFHRWWLTLPASVVVLGWWGLFLVLAPIAYRSTLAGEAGGAAAGQEGSGLPR